jgi:hypothetical protein
VAVRNEIQGKFLALRADQTQKNESEQPRAPALHQVCGCEDEFLATALSDRNPDADGDGLAIAGDIGVGYYVALRGSGLTARRSATRFASPSVRKRTMAATLWPKSLRKRSLSTPDRKPVALMRRGLAICRRTLAARCQA